jgi:hypothetical protein
VLGGTYTAATEPNSKWIPTINDGLFPMSEAYDYSH